MQCERTVSTCKKDFAMFENEGDAYFYAMIAIVVLTIAVCFQATMHM